MLFYSHSFAITVGSFLFLLILLVYCCLSFFVVLMLHLRRAQKAAGDSRTLVCLLYRKKRIEKDSYTRQRIFVISMKSILQIKWLELRNNQSISDVGCEKLLDCLGKVKLLGLTDCSISAEMTKKLNEQATMNDCDVLV